MPNNIGSLLKASLCMQWGFVFSLLLSTSVLAKPAVDWFTDSRQDKPLAQRISGLSDDELDSVMLGRSFFSIPWVVAPSATTARDGLGPLFNANTCASCHVDNGAGQTLGNDGSPLRALVVKLAQPSKQVQAREQGMMNIPDPHYGNQIAINGTGSVPPEASVHLAKHKQMLVFPDGSRQALTAWQPVLKQLAYGALDKDTVLSLRQAPTLAGMGLVAKVDADTILAWADAEDKDGDGISGRANWVRDLRDGKFKLGKYGWKAGQPTVLQQTADAAAHDMGLTNPLFPREQCTDSQQACLEAPHGRPSPLGTLDLPQPRLQAIANYVQSFKAPQPEKFSEEELQGKVVFLVLGCGGCHREQLTTKDGIEFSPYSDYLLHDMGSGLADGRPEFEANPQEWRTAPLWGVGARVRAGQRFLHDARAASPFEAVLWHGGEAEAAKQRFMALPENERQALLAFLEAL